MFLVSCNSICQLVVLLSNRSPFQKEVACAFIINLFFSQSSGSYINFLHMFSYSCDSLKSCLFVFFLRGQNEPGNKAALKKKQWRITK